ncbi:DUF3918 family protein [Heyndrickxia ginsengihumi]|uniref:DUF3918 domain-containing protein n=1 Tax=Heyndrickxia ginsengihumi TaxID=363870 RepID=A0A6M0P6X3_9BACI|nr:YrzQ family protein [Heyndrickxia ginsengihumi]MBE6183698.1 DUF3918 domain-containing protein [Bacillus sp. (in: firmicutes)]MCM3021825.1 YrzQ family protein [Heyndrickxia ginsengihumi]NEY19759.1 DUF3918 domain-containing protein [Heyndrickxia ginsengihumi]
MNKTVVTMLGFGAGIAATIMSQNGTLNGRNVRKITKRMRRALR